MPQGLTSVDTVWARIGAGILPVQVLVVLGSRAIKETVPRSLWNLREGFGGTVSIYELTFHLKDREGTRKDIRVTYVCLNLTAWPEKWRGMLSLCAQLHPNLLAETNIPSQMERELLLEGKLKLHPRPQGTKAWWKEIALDKRTSPRLLEITSATGSFSESYVKFWSKCYTFNF